MAAEKRSKGMILSIIFAVVVIVGVGLTILFINIFTPKTTKSLAEHINSVTTSGYLSESDENVTDITSYISQISKKGIVTEQEGVNLISNYLNALPAYQTMAQFFARQIVFSTYTGVYKSNASEIIKELNAAQSKVNELTSYLDENLPIATTVAALELTWLDCEPMVRSIIEYTTNAMEKLKSVYDSCVDSKLINNQFTDVIFAFCTDEMELLLVGGEKSGETLKTIVDTYLTETGEGKILQYSYNSTLQDRVDDLSKKGEDSDSYDAFIAGSLI